jgi:hypothetical protein
MTTTSTKRIRSVAGAVLLGMGAFLLRESLDLAATRLDHVLDVSQGPGLLTAVTMAATRGWQVYALDRLQFVHDCLLFLLASCWPMLLIVGGAYLSRDTFSGGGDEPPAQDGGNLELPRQFGDIQ